MYLKLVSLTCRLYPQLCQHIYIQILSPPSHSCQALIFPCGPNHISILLPSSLVMSTLASSPPTTSLTTPVCIIGMTEQGAAVTELGRAGIGTGPGLPAAGLAVQPLASELCNVTIWQGLCHLRVSGRSWQGERGKLESVVKWKTGKQAGGEGVLQNYWMLSREKSFAKSVQISLKLHIIFLESFFV